MINKIFSWGKKKENISEEKTADNTVGSNKENTKEFAKINFNNEVKFEKNSSKK